MKLLHKTLLIAVAIAFPFAGMAQNSSISGRVTDHNGDPVVAASVIVKGTTNGAMTGVNGDYDIAAPADATLVFSFLGMETKEEAVGSRTRIDVVMGEDTHQIDEVVVVGYGVQKAKDLTAPIAVVKGEELGRMAVGNAASALQGKVAGVQVINGGAPGAGAAVKIRGTGSIGDYAKPLYIVDGTFVNNLDFIGAGDIESMSILKDASAAAIYGVRAANGVVLVTTKKGTYGKPVISYDGYAGVQVPVNVMKMANKEQYVELLNLANEGKPDYVPRTADGYQPINGEYIPFPANTDWYGELLRNAAIQNHSLDISGMGEGNSYSAGLSYFTQDGIINADNGYQRYNLRGRFEQKAAKWLKVGVSAILSNADKQSANENALRSAYWNPPVYPVFNDNNVEAFPLKFDAPQRYGYGNSYANPVAAAEYHDSKEEIKRIMYSAFAEFNIIDQKLTFKTSYNQDYQSLQRREFQPATYVGGSQGRKQSTMKKTFENRGMYILDNVLTYSDQRGAHNFTAMLGQSIRSERMNNLWGSAEDVSGADEQSKYLKTGSYKDRNTDDGGHRYNGLSAFARGTYGYAGKYLASFTFRADASSKYQQKWGYFPSAGLGWVLSEEDFLKNHKVFNFLKVRASWGMLGNDNIPANSSQILGQRSVGTSAVFGETLVDGVGAQTVVQNFLRWEVVSEWNAGADAAFLNKRLTAEADFYYRTTNNVVFEAPVAAGGNRADLLGNNGKVLNTGVELTLGWADRLNGNLSYHISANATTIHNEVLELQGREYIPGGSVSGGFATRTQVGQPIGAFYGYKVVGVYQTKREALLDNSSAGAGGFKYENIDGTPGIQETDKQFLGSPIPFLIGGVDLGMEYRGFDISVVLQYQVGNKIFNQKRMNRDSYSDGNYDLDYYQNAWKGKGTSDKYPSPALFNGGLVQQPSSFFVEDGSYFRIQNLQAGYTFSANKVFRSLRIYVSAQRPLTLFGYNGFSPEVSGSPISMGIDNNLYPMAAVYSVGLKATF